MRGAGLDERRLSLCTPCGTALAASWDAGLVRSVGALIGAEARRQDVQVVLGPMLNLQRSPLGGRGFECLGEDPLLAGTLGAAWIAGVQAAGVAACPKHLVANDSETGRTRLDCVVDERALREVYLRPFELAAAAGAWAMMAAYNAVNGTPCFEHAGLIRGVLKDEWGWDGAVVSDWYALRTTVESALAGVDLEMPGPPRAFGPALAAAVADGRVPAAVLDDKARRLLRLAGRVRRPPAAPPPPPGLLREAAAAGMVLLRNEGRLLPLAPPARLAVVGAAAADPCLQGGGSAQVSHAPAASPLAAVRARWPDAVTYERGCAARTGPGPLHPLCRGRAVAVEYLAGGQAVARERREASTLVWEDGLPGAADSVRVAALLEPEHDGAHAFSLRASGPARLLVDGREVAALPEGPEGVGAMAVLFADSEARGEAELRAGAPVRVVAELRAGPGREHVLAFGCRPPEPPGGIERAVAAAASADAAIVVVGTTEEVESESVDRSSTALPGRQAELVRRVAAANPATVVVVNAGAAVDLACARAARAVLYAWFGGQEMGRALAAVLAGDLEPGGRLPVTIARAAADYPAYDTRPDASGRLRYAESTRVGHRHFAAAGIAPEFCFGHGLGYTDFAYEGMTVAGTSEVRVRLRNTGGRAGKEVIQLYVGHELAGFAAVRLEPGEARTVALAPDARAFSRWDPSARAWTVVPGWHELRVGRSSLDIRLVEPVTINA